MQIQNHAYHTPHNIIPAQTANALPPSTTWPSGCANTVLININSDSVWPHSGLNGMIPLNFCLTEIHSGSRASSCTVVSHFPCHPPYRHFPDTRNEQILIIHPALRHCPSTQSKALSLGYMPRTLSRSSITNVCSEACPLSRWKYHRQS